MENAFNVDRERLAPGMHAPIDARFFGSQALLGMPFAFGSRGNLNGVLLDREPVTIDLGGLFASYLVIAHRVVDVRTSYSPGFAEDLYTGDELAGNVAEYELVYGDGDGERHIHPILRRFAIQQTRIVWGASAFAAIPAIPAVVFPTASESYDCNRLASTTAGCTETRQLSGRDSIDYENPSELP